MARSRTSALGLCLASAAWLLFSSAPAQAKALGPKWHAMDQAAEQSLLAGRAAEARRTLDRVIDQMQDRMGPGEAGKQAMGIVLMHRALAQAELGHPADALWDWAVALNFNPALANEDLSRFGSAGTLLTGHPLRTLGAFDTSGNKPPATGPGREDVEPPKVRQAPPPHFPAGALEWGHQGAIVIQTIISTDGDVTQPIVLQDLGSATLAYSALEAVRQWKFEPARLDGKPVAVIYNLTINYRRGP